MFQLFRASFTSCSMYFLKRKKELFHGLLAKVKCKKKEKKPNIELGTVTFMVSLRIELTS